MEMTDRELAMELQGKSVSGIALEIKDFRTAVLKEAAERLDVCLMTQTVGVEPAMREILKRSVYGDHATKMTDLAPVVQDAVQKNFGKLIDTDCAESNGCSGCAFFSNPERRCYDCSRAFPQDKNRRDLYKARNSCPTCAESVDIKHECKTCKHYELYDMIGPCNICYPPKYAQWTSADQQCRGG